MFGGVTKIEEYENDGDSKGQTHVFGPELAIERR